MEQGDVDPAEAEALEAVLERAPGRVVAVVEHRSEGQGIAELRSPGLDEVRAQEAPHLRGQGERLARRAAQHRTDAVLAQTVAVVGGGVEVAHTGRECFLHRLPGLRLPDRTEEIAERGAAEAELGDLGAGRAQAAEDPVSFGPILAASFRQHRRRAVPRQWGRGDHLL